MTLEKNIIDTVREWQEKLGYSKENIGLYYPKESVIDLIGLKEKTSDISNEALVEKIKGYFSDKAPWLADTNISYKDDRFCMNISAKACEYIYENTEISELLVGLIQAIRERSMEAVAKTFSDFAAKSGGTLVEKTTEDLGKIYYFEQDDVDPYVYCIHADEFEMSYHRFTKSEYQKF